MISAKALGLDLQRVRAALRKVPAYRSQYQQFLRLSAQSSNEWPVKPSFPCLLDAQDASGVASGAYFHQDLLVARRIFERNPEQHVDVGSRVDGFVAHVAVFRPITVIDIRPPPLDPVRNIQFIQHDLMKGRCKEIDLCDSLSSLHALEHFGLGRYGDPIDSNGHTKGLAAMAQLVRPGGTFYLSVPIGIQRVEFNAHRIFRPTTVLEIAKPWFEVEAFSVVDDHGRLHDSLPLEAESYEFGGKLNYGCGIFEFKKCD